MICPQQALEEHEDRKFSQGGHKGHKGRQDKT
jgi:hypothetical protein